MNPEPSSSMTPDVPGGERRAGQMLRAAREAKGIHLAMLSVALKVPTRKLEALERDDHSAFQDVTFLRALAQAVCRHLGMDAAPVLAALPQAVNRLPAQRPPLDVRVKPTVEARHRRSMAIRPSRTVLWLALLMLLSTAALIWWPAMPPVASGPAVVSEEPAQAHVPMGQASNPLELPAVPPAAPPDPVAAASMPAQTSGLLLRARQSTWIEVVDGKGETLVKRQVNAGETLRYDAQAPVFVYASQADSIELLWQGQAVDLLPHTRNNELRLKIKP